MSGGILVEYPLVYILARVVESRRIGADHSRDLADTVHIPRLTTESKRFAEYSTDKLMIRVRVNGRLVRSVKTHTSPHSNPKRHRN